MKEFEKFVDMVFSDYVEDYKTKTAKNEFMAELELDYQAYRDADINHKQAVNNVMMNFSSEKDYFANLDIKQSILDKRQKQNKQNAKLDPFIDFINNFNWILTLFAIVIYIALGILTVSWYKWGWPIIPLAIIADYFVTKKQHKEKQDDENYRE